MREAESEPRDDLKPGVCLSVKVRVSKPSFQDGGGCITKDGCVLPKRKKQKARPKGVNLKVRRGVLLKRKKAESEAQRGKRGDVLREVGE